MSADWCPSCGAEAPLSAGDLRGRCGHCGSVAVLETGGGAPPSLAALPCPDCGCPSEVPEDDTSVRCPRCRALHVFADRGRPRRWYAEPALSASEAAAEVPPRWEAGTIGAELVFVPYWRRRANVYYWETGFEKEKRPEFADPAALLRRLVAPLAPRSRLFELAFEDGSRLSGFSSETEPVRRLEAYALDRSTPAFPGPWPATLSWRVEGGRRLPYEPSHMPGRALAPSIPREQAEKHLSRSPFIDARDGTLDAELEFGTVVGERTSLVWNPFWLLPALGGRRAAVDAAGARFAGLLEPADARLALGGEVQAGAEGAAPPLLPARCPDCAGEFAVEGFESVFFCRPCQTAWTLGEGRLVRQSLVVAGAKAASDAHLPVWRLRVSIETPDGPVRDQGAFRRWVPDWRFTGAGADPSKPILLYVPAWGNRLVPRMSSLARRLTREQLEPPPGTAPFGRVARALYGPREAERLSAVVLLGVLHLRPDLARDLLRSRLAVEAMELVLLPAKSGRTEWVDAVSGSGVLAGELSEPSRASA